MMKGVREMMGENKTSKDGFSIGKTVTIPANKSLKIPEYKYRLIDLNLFEQGKKVASLTAQYYTKPQKAIYVTSLKVEEDRQGESAPHTSGVGGTIVRKLIEHADKRNIPILLEDNVKSPDKNMDVQEIYRSKGFKYMGRFTDSIFDAYYYSKKPLSDTELAHLKKNFSF